MPELVQVEPDGLNRLQRRAIASNKPRPRPRFVTITEACNYLACSRSYFYDKILSKLKTCYLGKRRLIEFASLEELADKLLADSAQPAE
jgi:excisionase family DNA binding protein